MLPLGQDRRDVDRADHAVLGRAERHLDERRAAGQQRRQRASGGRLGRPLVAAKQHPADRRVDSRQHQRQHQIVQADQGRHRVHGLSACHRSSSIPSPSRIAERNVDSASADGAHSPRSAASSSRSAIARSAHGFDSAKNFRRAASPT